jgi:hypothetical protein
MGADDIITPLLSALRTVTIGAHMILTVVLVVLVAKHTIRRVRLLATVPLGDFLSCVAMLNRVRDTLGLSTVLVTYCAITTRLSKFSTAVFFTITGFGWICWFWVELDTTTFVSTEISISTISVIRIHQLFFTSLHPADVTFTTHHSTTVFSAIETVTHTIWLGTFFADVVHVEFGFGF